MGAERQEVDFAFVDHLQVGDRTEVVEVNRQRELGKQLPREYGRRR